MTVTVWTVPGTVERVIDGDTIVAAVDLGWNVILRSAVRIDGLAAPELSTPEGKAARSYAESLLPAGTQITVISKKLLGSREKYGRVLGAVAFRSETGAAQTDFAAAMIAAGHAVAWDGTGKQPT